jgi:hypothetical protein
MSYVTVKLERSRPGRKRGRVKGQVVKPYEVWPKVSAAGKIEQRLLWEHMDADMSEDEWFELCDRVAGRIPGGLGA